MKVKVLVGSVLLFFLAIPQGHAFSDLRIGSFNIRNFTSPSYLKTKAYDTNLSELKRIIKQSKADILAVQEIGDSENFANFIDKNFQKYVLKLSSCGGLVDQKLGFLYDKTKYSLLKFQEDQSINIGGGCKKGVRPAIIARFKEKLTGNVFSAIALHLKAGAGEKNVAYRQMQHQKISEIIQQLKIKGHEQIIVLGDMNTTNYLAGESEYKNYHKFVNKNRLESFSHRLRCTSYWGGSDWQDDISESSLLDHIMISEKISQKLSYSKIEVLAHCKKVQCNKVVQTEELGLSYEEVSDHCPIVATLSQD